VKCQAPFQSDRISQYLSPAKAAAIQTPVPPEPSPPAEPLKARRKSPSRSRRPKN
jgi:hypothetical protein